MYDSISMILCNLLYSYDIFMIILFFLFSCENDERDFFLCFYIYCHCMNGVCSGCVIFVNDMYLINVKSDEFE